MEKFADFITEAKLDTDIEVAVLTKLKSKKPELVSNLIERVLRKEVLSVISSMLNKHGLTRMT